MPAKVHDSFRISNAKQFKESFHELAEHKVGLFLSTDSPYVTANTATGGYDIAPSVTLGTTDTIPTSALDDNMYLFIGRVTPWNEWDNPKHIKDRTIQGGFADSTINENEPPHPIDSVKYGNFDHWDDMIAAKKVNGNDVSHVIKRERPIEIQAGQRGWTTLNRYDQYDDRAEGLFDDDMMMHTINERFRVFKCMKMGLGAFRQEEIAGANTYIWDHRSYDEPQNTNTSGQVISEDFMNATGDGYQWKFLYTISAGEALKFVTTSYIPVRTIRQANGVRPNDFTEQYEVEDKAQDGTILNVHVEKNQVVDSSKILGYEPVGGDGYIQFAYKATGLTVAVNSAAVSDKFKVVIGDITDSTAVNDCQYPSKACAAAIPNASGAVNQFDLTDLGGNIVTKIIDEIGGTGLIGYGLRITDLGAAVLPAEIKDYVLPISKSVLSGSVLEIYVDDDFVDALATGFGAAFSTTTPFSIEVNPRIEIDANFESSSSDSTRPDLALQAYAIVEPKFNDTVPSALVYDNKEPGRIVDAKVLRGGEGHTRVDETRVTPDVATYGGPNGNPLSANTAIVHACLPPVGGHGFDPVAELGGYNVMINARFEGSESDEFSVGNEFRKIGILKNPVVQDASNRYISADAYTEYFREQKSDQCYKLYLANAAFDYANTAINLNLEPDMKVDFFEGPARDHSAGNKLVATATVVDYDAGLKRMRVCSPRKDFATVLTGGVPAYIASNTKHSIANTYVWANTTATGHEEPGMKAGSGEILYMENRSIVSRSANQVEDLKISVQFVNASIEADADFNNLPALNGIAPNFLSGVWE